MQVSSVCANMFLAVDFVNSAMRNEKHESSVDIEFSSFSPSAAVHDLENNIYNINEWKNFCQEQIMANNFDYIV